MNKKHLAYMTWKEAEEAFKKKPVALVPAASIEQHGPQTPMGDYLITELVSVKIAEKTNAILVPTLPFGYSEYFKGFPGTISLRSSTVFDVLEDVCNCLFAHGLDHILFVNGHRGNEPAVEHLARKIRAERGLITAAFCPFDMCSRSFLAEIWGKEDFPRGHGSEPMTSIWAHMSPEHLRMDLAHSDKIREFQGFSPVTASTAKFKDVMINLYLDYHEMTPTGIHGDPTKASAEVGRKVIDRMVEYGIELVNLFEKMDNRVKSK
jgi:creatinine amidohydrolase